MIDLLPEDDDDLGFTLNEPARMGLDVTRPLRDADTTGLNETVVPKTYRAPRPDHVEHLRRNPDLGSQFDEAFGPGAAAAALGKPPTVDKAERLSPETTGPQLTPKALVDGTAAEPIELPGIVVEGLGKIDRDDEKTRSVASKSSMDALLKAGRTQDAKAWIDNEVQTAESALKEVEARILKASPRERRDLDDLQRVLQERLATAREVREDAFAVEREMDPQTRVALAMLMERENRVIARHADTLAQFDRDPAFREDMMGRGAFRGLDGEPLPADAVRKILAQNVTDARKRAAQMAAAMQAGKQRGSIRNATTPGEMVRGVVRGVGIATEMLGAGGEYWADENPELAEIAGLIKRFGANVRQDTSAKAIRSMFDIENATQANMWAWSTIAEGLGTTLPVLSVAASGGVIGASGALSIGIVMGQGEMKNALEDAFAAEGMTLSRADLNKYVGTYGTVMGALDAASALLLLNPQSFSLAAKQGIKRRIATAIAQGVKRGALTEGLTEGMQSVIKNLGVEDATGVPIDWAKYAPELLEETISGSLSGGFMSLAASRHTVGTELEKAEREEFLKRLDEVKREIAGRHTVKTDGETAAPDAEPAPAPEPEPAEAGAREAETERRVIVGKARAPRPEPAAPPKREPAPPRPPDILSVIRERGGIIDETGDLKAMDAPAGIIAREGEGIAPDRLREILVEQGYLIEPDPTGEAQTTVNDVYDLVSEALAGRPVVPVGREAELEAYEAWRNRGNLKDEDANRIISDLQADLEQYGIAIDDLSPVEEQRIVDMVRNEGLTPDEAFERNAMMRGGGDPARQAAQRAAAPQDIPFPSMTGGEQARARPAMDPAQALPKVRRYLRNGGSLSRKAYRELARAAGVPQSDVRALLEQAEQAGIVKRDRRGAFRRGDLSDPTEIEIDDLDAALSPADMQEAVTKMARQRLLAGQTVRIGDKIFDKLRSDLEPMFDLVPQQAGFAAMRTITPRPLIKKSGMVDVEFEDLRTGETFTLAQPIGMKALLGLRAAHLPAGFTSLDGNAIIFAPLSLAGQGAASLRGQAYHESLHLAKSLKLLSEGAFDRLVSHAANLRVMDMQLGTFLKAVGDPVADWSDDATLEFEYRIRYEGRSDIEAAIAEESVAHFIELAHAGHWLPQETESVQDILDEFFSGRMWGQETPQASGDVMAAIQSFDERPRTPGLDMSREARLRRARDMGFDTETVWYHGMKGQMVGDEFRLSEFGDIGAGIYVTQSQIVANSYANSGIVDLDYKPGSGVYPLFSKAIAAKADVDQARKELPFPTTDQAVNRWLADRGFAGRRFGANNENALIFNSADLRSVNAAFDPANDGSPLLMAAIRSLAERNNAIPLDEVEPDINAPHPDRPVLAFHGTPVDFGQFDLARSSDIGLHFGTAAQANDRVSIVDETLPSRVIPVVLNVSKPMTMNDLGHWKPLAILKSMRRQGIDVDESILASELDDTPQNIAADYERLRQVLEFNGYDAIRYLNAHEGGDAVMGDGQWSYIVWNKGAVKSATDPDRVMFALAGSPRPGGRVRVPRPGIGSPMTDRPGRSLSELIEDLNAALATPKALPLPVRTGRLSPGLKAMAGKLGLKLQGQYNTQTGVIRLQQKHDIETMAHEGGHALEQRFGDDFRNMMELHRNELDALASPGSDTLSEGFAEFFRMYVTNPTVAENKAPDFFDDFSDYLDRNEPALRTALDEIQSGYEELINTPSGGLVMSSIQSAARGGFVTEIMKTIRKKGAKTAVADWMDVAYTATLDTAHPVKLAAQELVRIAGINIDAPLGRGQSIGIAPEMDPYKLLRLARNGYQRGHVDLMTGVTPYGKLKAEGPSFRDALMVAFDGIDGEWSEDNMAAFGAYLASRRMVQEWTRFENGELDRAPDKWGKADHEQAVRDLEQGNPAFRNGAAMLYDFQNRILTKMMDAGMLSQERYHEFSARTDYVPVNRVMDDEQVAATEVGRDGRVDPIKRFRGSTRDIINPLESIAKFTYEVNYMIARNDALKALYALARAAGPGGGAIAERIPASQMTGTRIDVMDAVKNAADRAGVDPADQVFMLQAIEDTIGTDADAVLFKAREPSTNGEPILWLWEDGRRVPIRLADGAFGREMYEAFMNIGGVYANDHFVRLLTYPSQWLRAGITLDPAFLAANFFRDQLSAWILTEDFVPFSDGARGTTTAARDLGGGRDADLDLYNYLGGIMGGQGVEELSPSRTKRQIARLRRRGVQMSPNAINPLSRDFWKWTGATETGTRLQLFRNAMRRARKDGATEIGAAVEAAFTANDYIDFSRHGSRTFTVRQMMLFLNVALQGLNKTYRVAVGQSDNKITVGDLVSPYIKKTNGHPLTVQERKMLPLSAKFYAKMTVLAALGYGLHMLYEDDEEYQEIPEYFRSTHYMFRVNGQWFRLPRPFELGAPGLALERAHEYFYRGDEAAMERLRSGLYGLLVPPHSVPGVKLAFELALNKKFGIGETESSALFSSLTGDDTGQALVSQQLQKLPPEMQYTAYTSEFSKWFAQQTGLSAAKIDHVITGLGGGLGRSALELSNFVNPDRVKDWQDQIVVRRFTADPARSSQSKREFWEQMGMYSGEMQIAATAYKELQDRGQQVQAEEYLKRLSENERAFAVLESHGTAAQKREHPLNRAKLMISTLNGMRRELDSGELKDPDGQPYTLQKRKLFKDMLEQVQMREGRNALVVIGHPGWKDKSVMPTDAILTEFATAAPTLMDELEARLNGRLPDFDDVRAGWPALRASLLDGSFALDNPVTRKSGRRAQ